MESWLKERLTSCLQFDIPDEMIKFILGMKSNDEIDEYFESLLNPELEEHRILLNDIKQRLFRNKNKGAQNRNQEKLIAEKKTGSEKSVKSLQLNQPASQTGTKKKTKYVNLYTKDGELNDVVLLKGRHRCECQASRHKLINNCLKCGRIVCEQEGSGPCLFCGNLVCSENEKKVIHSSTKKGENLKRTLMEQNRPKGWEEALAQRNRLLEYDQTAEKRTTVIDDESDYFKTNSVWLSDSERKKLQRMEEEIQKSKHASRLNRKITIDFTDREIIEEPQLIIDYNDSVLNQIVKTCDDSNSKNNIKGNNLKKQERPDDVHPELPIQPPKFISGQNLLENENKVQNFGFDNTISRVQDKELLEIQDMRNCLSMHQPWASLLISGIKRHEGRTWYTSHRGRLWIASTAKLVDMEYVKRMEQFYRVLKNDENIIFPTQYPSGCLLGCVSVQECFPQEEYKKLYPDGESDSPFVLICSDPQELPIRFPIKGQHKIYKLDPKIHNAATKSLQRLAKLKAQNFESKMKDF